MTRGTEARRERDAAHRAEIDSACEIVHGFIQGQMKAGDEPARRAYQAFCILRNEARAERTFDAHLGERLAALEARVTAVEARHVD